MFAKTASLAMSAAALTVAVAVHAEGSPIAPGLWMTTTKVERVTGPGASPPILAMAGKVLKSSRCISPEAAKRGPQDLLKSLGPSCSFSHYAMTVGRLDARMVCQRGLSTTTSTLAGLFAADRYSGRVTMVTTGSAAMTLVTSYSGQRVGDCR